MLRPAARLALLLIFAAACAPTRADDPVPVAHSCSASAGGSPGARTILLGYYRPGGYPILVSQGGDEPSTATPFETWTWNCGWVHAGGPDPQLWGYAMAYDPALHKTVLAGARTLAWNGTRWEDLHAKPPVNLGTTAMVFDSARGELVLVDSFRYGVNTWTFDGKSWTKKSAAGPANEAGAALEYDPRSRSVVLFGGFAAGSGGGQQVTWMWDGSSWHLLDLVTSPPGGVAFMAYDEVTQQMILVTYDPSGYGTQTWEWTTGKDWRRLDIAGPTLDVNAGLIYDPARGELFLWNGSSAWTYVGTWSQVPPA